MSRGGFSRKSFTSSFIALNFILCHLQILKLNKVTLFLQIGEKNLGKQTITYCFVVVYRKALILSGDPIWRRLKLKVCFMALYFLRKLPVLEIFFKKNWRYFDISITLTE